MTRTMFSVNIDRSEPVALHDQVAEVKPYLSKEATKSLMAVFGSCVVSSPRRMTSVLRTGTS